MIKQDILENQVKSVILGIGSNLGNKKLNIEKAKSKLEDFQIKIIKCSSKYESLSWPDIKKPKYINIIIKVETEIKPLELLKICKLIEIDLGRKKTKKNAPRICDIDIIDYKGKNVSFISKNLFLPHPAMDSRNFVLLPLFEIDQTWIHPKTKDNIVKLIKSIPILDLRSIKQI